MSAAQCPQQRGFHEWLVTHMMPIAMVPFFTLPSEWGTPITVLDKTKNVNRGLEVRLNLPFLSRSSTTRQFSAFAFLGKGNCSVTVFIIAVVLFKPGISGVGAENQCYILGICVFNLLNDTWTNI